MLAWEKIKNLLFDAGTDLQKLISNNEYFKDQNSFLSNKNEGLKKDIDIEKKVSIESANEIDNLNKEIDRNESIINKLNTDIATANAIVGNQKDKIEEIERVRLLLTQKNEQLVGDNKTLRENAAANQQIINRKHELDIELEGLKRDSAKLQKDFDDLKEQNTKLLSEEDNRKRYYEDNVQNLNLIREQIEAQRSKEKEDLNNAEIGKIRKLKETWSNHQDNVKNVVKKNMFSAYNRVCRKSTVQRRT